MRVPTVLRIMATVKKLLMLTVLGALIVVAVKKVRSI